MHALQPVCLAELVQILADCLRRNVETFRERFNIDPTVTPGDLQNVQMSWR
jgi:hypothetical protein